MDYLWNTNTSDSIVNPFSKENVEHTLLSNRGMKEDHTRQEFLHPSLEHVTIERVGISKQEVEKAVARIVRAIKEKETIIVYTDYDADGVCGGTIMWEALFALGAKVLPYIPDRVTEGYGLSKQGIESVKKNHNASLIITVDHGIVAKEYVAFARTCGIDTIVLDHHTAEAEKPDAVAIVHTTKLCATGVALLFAHHLLSTLLHQQKTLSQEKNLDIAALATVADIVPLTGANRAIVTHGLKALNQTERIGLTALFASAGIKKGAISVGDIGFILAPRLNAAGRMNHALPALQLLCTRSVVRAQALAEQLNAMNLTRQQQTEKARLLGITKVQEKNLHQQHVICIADEAFEQGIIGLVAGKLVEKFYRPSIVIAKGATYSKASARSIPGFNIVEALRNMSHLLLHVGGHPMAAGFTCYTKHLEEFSRTLASIAAKELLSEAFQRSLAIDFFLPLAAITEEFFSWISPFAPFGTGNPEPTFASTGVDVLRVSQVGSNGKHLSLTLGHKDAPGKHIPAIGFGMGDMAASLMRKRSIDIAYTIRQNTFHQSLQLHLKDVKIRQ